MRETFDKLSRPKRLIVHLVTGLVNILIAFTILKYLTHQKQKKASFDSQRSSSWIGNLVLAAAPVEALDTLRAYGDGLSGLFFFVSQTMIRGWHFWLFIFALLSLNFAMWQFIGAVFSAVSHILFTLRDTFNLGEGIVGTVSVIISLLYYFVGLGYLFMGRVRENK